MVEYLADLDAYNGAVEATKNGGKVMIVDFTATWCPPCQMIGPKFEAMASDFGDVLFRKVDVDANSAAAQAAGIQCMPTFKIYKDGAEVGKLEGASEQGIKDLINQHK